MSRYFIVSTAFFVLFIVSLMVDGVILIPLAWYISLVLVYGSITTLGSIFLSMQYFVPVKFSGTDPQTIAITFDDGPVEGKTEKILDILKQRNIPATFFCIGNRIDKNQTIVKRLHEEGHLIGNHSYGHGATFDLQFSGTIIKELAQTDEAIFNAIGKRPKFFRPPYGVTNPMVAKAIKRRNYTVIGWSVRSFDSVIRDKNKLWKRIELLKGGDIVLFHDYSDSMLEILPDFLRHVDTLGLKVVRLDELLNEKAYV